MTVRLVLALMLQAFGAEPVPTAQHRPEWAALIAAESHSLYEASVLVVVGYHENHLHTYPTTRTPYFGTVDLAHRLGRMPTMAEGARECLRLVHFYQTVRCRGGMLSSVLGRYHHGTRGTRDGCWGDSLSILESYEIRQLLLVGGMT